MSRTDEASLDVAAPVDRVYGALVGRDALEQWLPPENMRGEFEHFDARVGGSYRLRLTYEDGAEGKSGDGSDVVDVRFVDIVPNERVVQAVDFESDDPAFAGTMTMTWAVEPLGDHTRVTITASNVPSGISADDHAAGLRSSLANLARYVT